MENTEHNRLQAIRFYSEAGALGYHLFQVAFVQAPDRDRRDEEAPRGIAGQSSARE